MALVPVLGPHGRFSAVSEGEVESPLQSRRRVKNRFKILVQRLEWLCSFAWCCVEPTPMALSLLLDSESETRLNLNMSRARFKFPSASCHSRRCSVHARDNRQRHQGPSRPESKGSESAPHKNLQVDTRAIVSVPFGGRSSCEC
jgi:hypothetical protein